MTAIRVLLADDHALVLAGIRALVEGLVGIQIIGEAHDGRDCRRARQRISVAGGLKVFAGSRVTEVFSCPFTLNLAVTKRISIYLRSW